MKRTRSAVSTAQENNAVEERRGSEVETLFPVDAGLDDSVLEEFNDFYADFPSLQGSYKLLGKIGEGTFSSVYKAADLKHFEFDNSNWCFDHIASEEKRRKLLSNTATVKFGKKTSSSSTCGLVALKRIYATSSPERIINELAILHVLAGHAHVAPLITAMRFEDQVIAVLPFFEHEDFRDYYLDMTVEEIKHYMRALLSGLDHVHSFGILHRDIKPSNFLFNRRKKTGVIVDFGLAQVDPKKAKAENKVTTRATTGSTKLGYYINDPRPSLRANRAGTRGFRAPEVLFKVANQTTQIDVWSAGVILLCILSGMFPFFASNDDAEALLEISSIYGKKAMIELATKLNRKLETNLPSIGAQHTLKDIACHFNPSSKDIENECFTLLNSLMILDPVDRLTAAEALEHPFFRDT